MNAIAIEVPQNLLLQSAHNAVCQHPGTTSAHLAQLAGCEREALLDLLYDLQKAGKVHCAELTVCRLTGRLANVWRPGRDPHLLPKDYAQALDAMEPPVDPNQIGLFA